MLQRHDADRVLVLEVGVAGAAVEEGEGKYTVAVWDGEVRRVGLEVAVLGDEVEGDAEVGVEHGELGLEVREGRGGGADDDGVGLHRQASQCLTLERVIAARESRQDKTYQLRTNAVRRGTLDAGSGVLMLARDDLELAGLLESPGDEVGKEGKVASAAPATEQAVGQSRRGGEIESREYALNRRILEHLTAPDESDPRVVPRLERTDESNAASRQPNILLRRLTPNVRRECTTRGVQNVGEKGVATDEVTSSPVQHGRPSTGGGGDEGFRSGGSRYVEEGRVEGRRGGGEVVDDDLTAVVRVELELAGKVSPDFGGGGGEDKEEVCGFRGGKSASDGLRRELLGCFCGRKDVQLGLIATWRGTHAWTKARTRSSGRTVPLCCAHRGREPRPARP